MQCNEAQKGRQKMANAALASDLAHRLPTPEEIESAAEAATALAKAKEGDGRLVIAGADGRELRLAPAIGDILVDLLG
ncbi:MAG: hypothetical protein ACK50G_02885, partial [bacterium]